MYNPDNYLFFYGGYLSNFYNAKFTIDNICYSCSEQYFMKKKQETFDKYNEELSNKILNETSPSKIKILGRKVKNYDENIWNELRYDIMKKGIYEKFKQNNDIKEKLLLTKDKILVEASPHDKIWGIGLDEHNAKIINPSNWKGLNLLGKALMEVRTELYKQ